MNRRDLLKLSPLALVPAVGHVSAATAPAREAPSGDGVFNVRRFGAAGDGKTVDTPAINRDRGGAAIRGEVP